MTLKQFVSLWSKQTSGPWPIFIWLEIRLTSTQIASALHGLLCLETRRDWILCSLEAAKFLLQIKRSLSKLVQSKAARFMAYDDDRHTNTYRQTPSLQSKTGKRPKGQGYAGRQANKQRQQWRTTKHAVDVTVDLREFHFCLPLRVILLVTH